MSIPDHDDAMCPDEHADPDDWGDDPSAWGDDPQAWGGEVLPWGTDTAGEAAHEGRAYPHAGVNTNISLA